MSRTVYPTSMVCHLWANGRTDYARNSTRNVYTQDGALYSYGSHFVLGAFLTNDSGARLLVLNSDGYSMTTARHKGEMMHALSRAQLAEALYVPGINRDSISGTDGVRKMARACLDSAGASLDKSQRARTNRPYLLNGAGEMLETARRLFDFVGDKRDAARVPSVDEHATKDDVRSLVVKLNGAKWLALAARKSHEAQREMMRLSDMVAQYRSGNRERFEWGNNNSHGAAGDIVARAERVADYFGEVAKLHSASGKRAPRVVVASVKTCNALRDEFAPLAAEEFAAWRVRHLADSARAAVESLAEYRRDARAMRVGTVGDVRPDALTSAARSLEWRTRAFRDAMRGATEDERTQYGALASRIERVQLGAQMQRAVAEILDSIGAHRAALHAPDATLPYAPNDPARILADARREGMRVDYFERTSERLAATLVELRVQCRERVDAARREREALARLRLADQIAAWRNGAPVRLPYEAPTMARIRGDMVETSRGASVPLSHALRLVRIAERVAARGGREWESGAGPMVGAFRASYIGADLAARIGCHEFSAEESQRIVAEIRALFPADAFPAADDVAEAPNA